MTRTKATAAPSDKRQQAETEFTRLVENVCQRGFHGTASVTVTIQDGHIQYTRVLVDRVVK